MNLYALWQGSHAERLHAGQTASIPEASAARYNIDIDPQSLLAHGSRGLYSPNACFTGKNKVSVLTTSSKAFTLDTNHTQYTTDHTLHILLPASSIAVTQLTQNVIL